MEGEEALEAWLEARKGELQAYNARLAASQHDRDVERSGAAPSEALAAVCASYRVGGGELRAIRAHFEDYDVDGSGTVDARELGALLRDMGGDYSDVEVRAILRRVDKSGDGAVDLVEFVRWWGGGLDDPVAGDEADGGGGKDAGGDGDDDDDVVGKGGGEAPRFARRSLTFGDSGREVGGGGVDGSFRTEEVAPRVYLYTTERDGRWSFSRAGKG